MWTNVQHGWEPSSLGIDSEDYKILKDGPHSAQKGFACHQFAFGGRWMSTHKTISESPAEMKGRYSAAKSRVCDIGQILGNRVKFSCGSYDQYSNLSGAIIYCDPPYRNSTCKYLSRFENNMFETWCKKMSMLNMVYVSGYEYDSSFTIIWSKQQKIKPGKGKNSTRRTEVLCVC